MTDRLGTILVTGAGGSVGGHLVRKLCGDGRLVRALLKPEEGHDLAGTGAGMSRTIPWYRSEGLL